MRRFNENNSLHAWKPGYFVESRLSKFQKKNLYVSSSFRKIRNINATHREKEEEYSSLEKGQTRLTAGYNIFSVVRDIIFRGRKDRLLVCLVV